MMDCQLLIRLILLTIRLGVNTPVISYEDFAFSLIYNSSLLDLQPQSSMLAVFSAGRLSCFDGARMHLSFLKGSLSSNLHYWVVWSCRVDFWLVNFLLRVALRWAVKCTRINRFTLPSLVSIIFKSISIISPTNRLQITNQSLPIAILIQANGGNYKDSKEQFYNGMAMASQCNKLPANFADKVLELQSLLDDSLSMDLITDLNQLYRIGIDYYIQYEPRRAQHFQKKMTKLLADPATLNLIESKSKISHVRSPQLATKSKISSEVARFKNCSSEYVRNIMEQSDKAIKRHEIIRNKDLNKQEEELQNRIMLKKYKSQEKLMKFNDVK